jgi:Na+/melibiose symporter-like transporter
MWIVAGRRLGKHGAYAAAAATIVIATTGFWFTANDPPWAQVLLLAAMLGVGFGGAQMLPFSIVGDIIQQTSAGSAGTYTGVWTAIEKAGLAAGPLIVGLLLQVSGFREGTAAGSQSEEAIAGVRAAISLFPALFVALSLPALLVRAREKT